MKLVLKPLLMLIYLKECISYPQTLHNKFQKSTTDRLSSGVATIDATTHLRAQVNQ
jgi:hypothetical protein